MGWLPVARRGVAEPKASYMPFCRTDVLVRLQNLLHTASLEAEVCRQVMPALQAAHQQVYSQRAATGLV